LHFWGEKAREHPPPQLACGMNMPARASITFWWIAHQRRESDLPPIFSPRRRSVSEACSAASLTRPEAAADRPFT